MAISDVTDGDAVQVILDSDTATLNQIGSWLVANGYGSGSGSGSGLTLEQTQDAVAAMLIARNGLKTTYDDTLGLLDIVNSGKSWISVMDADFDAKGDDWTDDWPAIQGAIDYALQNFIGVVVMPVGTYRTSDTIHLGYGVGDTAGNNGYNTIQLKGVVQYGHGADTALGKARVRIKPQFTDRPVVNIQGGRESGGEDIWIEGPTNLSVTSWGPNERADEANYIPAGYKNWSRAPFCGVCIDGYSGTADPTNPYPTPTYPAYMTPPASAYGRNSSSNCYWRRCRIDRTLVGIAVQPNSDANGDFMDFSQTSIYECRSGVAIGNTQARSTNYKNMRFGGVHTCIDGLTYKNSGGGNISGCMDNIHCDYCYQLLWYDATWSKPVVVTNFYSEVMSIIGGSQNRGFDATFIGGQYNLTQAKHTGSRDGTVLSARYDEVWRGTYAKFIGCKLEPTYFLNIPNTFARFENCSIHLDTGAPYPPDDEKKAMWSWFGGAILGGELGKRQAGPQFMDCRVSRPDGNGGEYNVGDAQNHNIFWSGGLAASGWLPYICTMAGRGEAFSLSSVTWTGRTMTGHSSTGYHIVGDVFRDDKGDWIVITAITDPGTGGRDIEGKLLTGYSYDGTNYTKLNPTYTSSTLYYFPMTSLDVLNNEFLFMVTTAGSPTITFINGNGSAQARPSTITTSTRLFWAGAYASFLQRSLPFPARTTVSSVDTNTVTMSSNAQISGEWAVAPGIARIR